MNKTNEIATADLLHLIIPQITFEITKGVVTRQSGEYIPSILLIRDRSDGAICHHEKTPPKQKAVSVLPISAVTDQLVHPTGIELQTFRTTRCLQTTKPLHVVAHTNHYQRFLYHGN